MNTKVKFKNKVLLISFLFFVVGVILILIPNFVMKKETNAATYTVNMEILALNAQYEGHEVTYIDGSGKTQVFYLSIYNTSATIYPMANSIMHIWSSWNTERDLLTSATITTKGANAYTQWRGGLRPWFYIDANADITFDGSLELNSSTNVETIQNQVWNGSSYVNQNISGAVSVSDYKSVSGNAYTVLASKLLTLSAVGYGNYTFEGFYVQASPTRYINASEVYTVTNNSFSYAPFISNATVQARWRLYTTTITFNKEGGSGGTNSVEAQIGTTVPNITVPTKSGYTFDGYYTGQNGSGTKYYNASGAGLVNVNSSTAITLYANWILNEYTLTVEPNGGMMNGSTNQLTYTQTSGTSRQLPTPTREGYVFKGWQLQGTGANLSGIDGSFESYAVGSNPSFTDQTGLGCLITDTQAYSGTKSMQFTTEASKRVYQKIAVSQGEKYAFSCWYKSNSPGGNIKIELDGGDYNWSGIDSAVPYGYADVGQWRYMSVETGVLTSDANLYAFVYGGAYGSIVYFDDYTVKKSTGTLSGDQYIFGIEDNTVVAVWQEDSWINNYSEPSGSGTSADPYRVRTAGELAYFAYKSRTQVVTDHIEIMNNINLAEHYWSPIGREDASAFSGVLEGNGYTIENLDIAMSGMRCVGLIGYAVNARIENLTIGSGTVIGGLDSGTIVGAGYGVTIRNCVNRAQLQGSQDIGGVIGRCHGGSIENVTNYGAVTGTTGSTGGVIGWCREYNTPSTLTQVINYGKVQATNNGNAGGIVAGGYRFNGTQLFGYGPVSSTGIAGGIFGEIRGTVTLEKIYTNNEVTGVTIGGIAGSLTNAYGTNTITGGYLTGNLKCTSGSNSGAVIGKTTGTNTIKDVFVGVTTGYEKMIGTGSLTLQNCVYELTIGSTTYKKYYASASDTYTGWQLIANKVYPPNLFWAADAAPADSNFLTKLRTAGYTAA